MESPQPWVDRIGGVVVLLVTALVFSGAIGNDFVNYDDRGYVFDPRTLRGLTWDNVIEAFTGVILGNYHPLAWLSHMADVEVFGLDPRGHHAVNVVLHAAVAVVVLRLFRRLGLGVIAAGVLALAFSLHPLRVESVAWVSERKDVLCALFYLLAVERWLAPDRSRALVFVLGLLALLSKPMAVSLPPVLVVVDVLLARRPWREALRDSAPLWVLAVLLAVITLRVQQGAMLGEALVPLSMRLQTAIAAQGAIYLPATVAPTCLHAPYLYPEAWSTATLLGSFVLVGGAVVVALLVRRRAPLVTAGVLWYAIAMAPVAGVVGVGIAPAADRYSYLPAVGLGLAVAGLLLEAGVRQPRLRHGGLVVLAVWAAALVPQTVTQIGVWRSTRSLWTQALTCTPDHPDVLGFMAREDMAEGRWAEGRDRAARAVTLRPNMPGTWEQLGVFELLLDRHPQARDAFIESLSWQRNDQAVAHTGLGVALLALGETAAGHRELALGQGPLPRHGTELAGVLSRINQPELARAVLARRASADVGPQRAEPRGSP
jgi:hypothetical protein